MDRTTRLIAAAALAAGWLLPNAAFAQESAAGTPAGGAPPEATAPDAGAPRSAAPASEEEIRQRTLGNRIQQRFQPDYKGRVEGPVQGQFAVPDRKGEPETKAEPTPAVPAQPIAQPPPPVVTPPAPAPAAVTPLPAPPAPRPRRVRLPQTGGDPLTLVLFGAGLAGLGYGLRRRWARG